MTNINLQTKITLSLEKKCSLLQLKDKSFILYTTDEVLLFNKNLTFNNLLFNTEKEEYTNITSIIQLKNEKILCCNNNLYIFTIKSNKKYEYKRIKMKNFDKGEKIMNVLELKNGEIIGVTNQYIINIKLNDNKLQNAKITQLYKVPYEWLLYGEDIFLNIYELKNNKLFMNFQSYFYSRRCPTSRPIKKYRNKIFIFNLKKLIVVYDDFKDYNDEIYNILFLKKCICINYNECLLIYDNIKYQLLKRIYINIKYINKYTENIIIGACLLKENNVIIIFDISNINDIKYQIFTFEPLDKYYFIENILIYKLENKKFLFYFYNTIYIVDFPNTFNFNFKHLCTEKDATNETIIFNM